MRQAILDMFASVSPSLRFTFAAAAVATSWHLFHSDHFRTKDFARNSRSHAGNRLRSSGASKTPNNLMPGPNGPPGVTKSKNTLESTSVSGAQAGNSKLTSQLAQSVAKPAILPLGRATDPTAPGPGTSHPASQENPTPLPHECLAIGECGNSSTETRERVAQDCRRNSTSQPVECVALGECEGFNHRDPRVHRQRRPLKISALRRRLKQFRRPH